MTKRELAVIMAYTGLPLLTDNDFKHYHWYAERLMGRRVRSHELPSLKEMIKRLSEDDMKKICKEAR